MTAPTLLRPPVPAPRPAEDNATRRDLLKGAGVLTLAGFLAACGGEGEQSGGGPQTRSVQHTAGSTQVPVAPRRVVALDGTIDIGLITLGLTPAAVNGKIEAWVEAIADQLPAGLDLQAVPRYDEDEPDLEAIAAVRPEVVIGTDLNHTELYDRLSRIAPTVLVERGSNGDWRRRLLAVADIVGRRDEAAAVEADYDATLAALPASVREATVAFIRPDSDGQFRFDSTAQAFAGSVAADAGIPVLTPPRVSAS